MDSRLLRVKDRIAKDFKNTKPTNSIRVPDDVRIAQYLMTPPEAMGKIAQDFPQYVNEMENLIARQFSKRGI